MKNALLLTFCLLLVSACSLVRIDSNETADSFFPPKASAEQVEYLETVPGRHVVVGYVTVNTERAKSMEEILRQMKKEAAVLGGDAVTDIKIKAGDLWERLQPQKLLGNAYVRAEFTATVIAFE